MPEHDSGTRPAKDGEQAAPAKDGEQAAPEGNGTIRRFVEDKIPTGLWVRVFVYVVAAHGVAAFLYLLFTLGAKNQ
ncbi:DUF6126 family protein [Streptomyces sp. SID11385]|uniref:DUF6126 family protein n=1 Tax=Streptomyces sp. SID11385 TaxID=2706031 RepID=UPI001EF2FA79|nr:DUF6126 family protein [Streptomyces sp. SID11385]